MKLSEYQKLAARTECNGYTDLIAGPDLDDLTEEHSPANHRSLHMVDMRLNHVVIGLAGEVGELATALQKLIYYRGNIDIVNVIEELGDCLWYIALACNTLAVPMETLLEKNINKLSVRYPDKYTDYNAKESSRDRQAERRALDDGVDYETRDA